MMVARRPQQCGQTAAALVCFGERSWRSLSPARGVSFVIICDASPPHLSVVDVIDDDDDLKDLWIIIKIFISQIK